MKHDRVQVQAKPAKVNSKKILDSKTCVWKAQPRDIGLGEVGCWVTGWFPAASSAEEKDWRNVSKAS